MRMEREVSLLLDKRTREATKFSVMYDVVVCIFDVYHCIIIVQDLKNRRIEQMSIACIDFGYCI